MDTAIGPKSAWNAGNALKTPELFGLDVTIRYANRDHFRHFDSIGWEGGKTKIEFQIKQIFWDTAFDLKNPQKAGKVMEMPELLRLDVTIRYADSDKKFSKPFLL